MKRHSIIKSTGQIKDHYDAYGLLIEVGAKVAYAPLTRGYIKRGHVIAIDEKGIQCQWDKPKRIDVCRICANDAGSHRDPNSNVHILGHWFTPIYDGVEPGGTGRPADGTRLIVVTGFENS